MSTPPEAAGSPIVVGITGPIGSGKSSVLATLMSLGAEGIDADRIAHDVMAPGGPTYDSIVAAFGQEVLDADGRIARKRLGERAFADRAGLARLEAIVHPAVIGVIRERVAVSTASMVAIEAIKLLESGLCRALCDEVWVTTCSRRQQYARLAASRGMSPEEVRRRLAAQMPVAQMAAQADRVIDTRNSSAETDLLVLRAWVELGIPLPSVQVRRGSADDAAGIAAVLNSVVREGGLTVLDRTYTPAAERAFLRGLPARACLTVAQFGKCIVGFQVIEPYVSYTQTMDHVARLGSYVVSFVRGQGLGRAMAVTTIAEASEIGFSKLVIEVRADNPGAQAFYVGLGFRPCGRLTRQVLVDGRYVDQLVYELFLDCAP